MADRRPLRLRSGAVADPAVSGTRTPLSNGEKARKALHQLLKKVPAGAFILIPRNKTEAHRRPDSLCVLLGIPFCVLGPLLFAAAIIVKGKKSAGLSVSTDGFDKFVSGYSWQAHHQLRLERRAASINSIAADSRNPNDPPSTRYFCYIFRGSKLPVYNYKPLAATDLVQQCSGIDNYFALSEAILNNDLNASVASIFRERRTTAAHSIAVDTASQPDSSAAPNLITPTEDSHQQQQQQQKPAQLHSPTPSRRGFTSLVETVESIANGLCNSSIEQLQRIIHSPPMRSPGFSPPLRRVRRFSDDVHPSHYALDEEEEDEIVVETVDEEEEKKEEDEDEGEGNDEADATDPPAGEELPAQPPAPPTVEQEKEASRQLDFDLRDADGLRPNRKPGGKAIRVTDLKQATGAMRTMIIWLAEQWGYNTAVLQRDKLLIAELASRVVFYDCGCPKAPKGRMFASWVKELEDARYSNNNDFASLGRKQLGSRQGTYCSRIEAAHPGYLHELYRNVCCNPKVTYRATFPEIAEAMNDLSVTDRLSRPRLYLTRHHLKVWFTANGGKVRKGWERPILTPERMAARVEWCKARKAELAAAEEAGDDKYHWRYYCFLDEKWFYIRSRRKKLKVLPRGPLEAEGAEDIPIERESSSRYATKVMYLGVIADPVEEFGFDGKIYLQRVSRMKKLQKRTYTENIIDDLVASADLQRRWHGYVNPNQDANQMIDFVAGTVFDLDEETKQRLVIRFKDHRPNGDVIWKEFTSFGNTATIRPKADWARRPLDIRDLVLQVKYEKGEEIPEDVSCDSEFMKAHMDSIGRTIRAKYHWVPPEDEIFLVMDNAGGHGTRDTIDKYVADLLEDHKVRVLWQEPRGPELNLLDLGAWVSLQSAVEKYFRGNRNNAEVLARKIEEVWSNYDAAVFHKIWDRWKLALDLIIADGGNNRLVNEHRGSLFTPAAPLPEDHLPAAQDYDVDADNDDADADADADNVNGDFAVSVEL